MVFQLFFPSWHRVLQFRFVFRYLIIYRYKVKPISQASFLINLNYAQDGVRFVISIQALRGPQ